MTSKIWLPLFFCILLHASVASAEQFTIVTLVGPPYASVQSGQVRGFAVDLVKEGIRRTGNTAQIILRPWKRALFMVKHGEADAIFHAVKTKKRTKFLNYAMEPLIIEETVAFKLKNSLFQLGPDLSGAEGIRLGIGLGFVYGPNTAKAFAENRFKELDYAISVDKQIQKLIAKRVDVFLGDTIVAPYIAKSQGVWKLLESIKDYNGEPVVLDRTNTYLAFSKASTPDSLAEAFSSALREMKMDGTYEVIKKMYIAP